MKHKNYILKVRLDPNELEKLQLDSKKLGISQSDFIRMLIHRATVGLQPI